MREKYVYLYLFATRSQLQTGTKKCKKKWRGGLKESIKLMLIIASQLQFFKDGINYGNGYKILSDGNLK